MSTSIEWQLDPPLLAWASGLIVDCVKDALIKVLHVYAIDHVAYCVCIAETGGMAPHGTWIIGIVTKSEDGAWKHNSV
jgi:hypothetical protein